MLTLWLPILLSTIALFFTSFLSWMVFRLHEKDWVKIDDEDRLIDTVREMNIPEGSYMFPGCNSGKEMNSPEYQEKYKAGPRGIISGVARGKHGQEPCADDVVLSVLQRDVRLSRRVCPQAWHGLHHRVAVRRDHRLADVLCLDAPARDLVQKPRCRPRDRIDRLCIDRRRDFRRALACRLSKPR